MSRDKTISNLNNMSGIRLVELEKIVEKLQKDLEGMKKELQETNRKISLLINAVYDLDKKLNTIPNHTKIEFNELPPDV